MLTKVILETSDPMSFDIRGADSTEIITVKSISGLLPGDLTLFTGELARNGGYYQGRRAGKRTPVFTFKLNPDYENDISVSDIREMLYRQFYEPQADSDGIQVVFQDDKKPDRYLVCYVEKWQEDLFSKDTVVQISTVCVDPFLYSVDRVEESDVNGWVSTNVTYDGSAETGLEVTLKILIATNTVILDLDGKTMELDGDFAVDDIITINTNEGFRYIRKNGTDIMGSLLPWSSWLRLKTSSEVLSVMGHSAGQVSIMDYSYRAAWWGV